MNSVSQKPTSRGHASVAPKVGVFVIGALVGAAAMALSTPIGQQDRTDPERDEAPTTTTGFEVIGESFFAVRVRDARAAAEWYAMHLGLVTANELDDPEGRFVIRILTRAGLTVELIEQVGTPDPPERAPAGHFKAGFFVSDIDAAFAALRNGGVDTDDGVSTDEALGVRMFVFRDLEGNRLQIFER